MLTFDIIFQLLSPELKDKLVSFHKAHEELMRETPASLKRHHCWPGGYYDHVLEVCNNALTLDGSIPLPKRNYTIDDLVVASYVHDLDKLFCRYDWDHDKPTSAQLSYAQSLGIKTNSRENKTSLSWKIEAVKSGRGVDEKEVPYFHFRKGTISCVASTKVCQLCAQHGIVLSDQALHAVTYHEGGWSQGMDQYTVLQPLAAIIHAADLLSVYGQNGHVCPVSASQS